MNRAKKLGLLLVLSEVKNGLNFSSIAEKYSIPKQTLDYYRGKLLSLGCIQKKGYGVWEYIKEVPIIPKDTIRHESDFRLRGHAFIWTITFSERQNWSQIIENYKKRSSRLKFALICNRKVHRTIFKQKKVWFTNKGMVVYEPLDFMGKSAPQAKGTAVFELDLLIKEIFNEFSIKLVPYEFICSREHFAYIKNQMAKQFNDRKMKINVCYNGRRFYIDHSDGEHEEEAEDVVTSVQAQKFYEDQVKTNFAVTPSFILESLNLMKQNLEITNQKIGFNEPINNYVSGVLKDFKPGYIR